MLPKGLLKEYSQALAFMMRGADMLTVLLAGWAAYFLRFHTVTMPPLYWLALLSGLVMTLLVFSFFNIYSSVRGESFINHIFHLLQAMVVTSFMLAGLSFFAKLGSDFSRIWFSLWMGLAIALLILLRCSLLMVLRFMRARGLNERHIVILGANELGDKLAETVQQALWTGYRVVTFMDDQPTQAIKKNIPVITIPADLSTYLTTQQIDEIWIALPLQDEIRIKAILYELRHHTITTRLMLDVFGLDLLNHSITDLAGFPVLTIRSTPMVGMNRIMKALEDRIIAGIILFLISPLLLIIALLVKCTSKGPVFFKQERLGWDGRIIKVYKFRTMVMHQEESGQVTQATMNDHRITPIGKFLRRTSLDELPQFFNVLQGRMSIVGPRPHALAHNELYKDSVHTYMQRHRVKPGITGWAQVNGWRGETDTLIKMQKRVEYDLYYINNWSLGFDLKIIFLTFFRGFINRNAY